MDLKFCRDEPVSDSTVPFEGYSYCPFQRNDTSLKGQQQIKKGLENDGIYNCLNRLDEHVFGMNDTDNKKVDSTRFKWVTDVNTNCPEGSHMRRCLGSNPNQCVWAEGKYFDNIKTWISIYFKVITNLTPSGIKGASIFKKCNAHA